MTQLGLDNLTEGERRRDEAIDRVEAHAPADWNDRALDALYNLAQRRPMLSADEVWEAGLERPPEPRALGAVMRKAVTLGYIEPTGDYRPSTAPGQHARPIQIFRSKVYR